MIQRLKKEMKTIGKQLLRRGKRRSETKTLWLYVIISCSSIERKRRLLDEKRVRWIARRMEMIIEETKERFEGKVGVEYQS